MENTSSGNPPTGTNFTEETMKPTKQMKLPKHPGKSRFAENQAKVWEKMGHKALRTKPTNDIEQLEINERNRMSEQTNKEKIYNILADFAIVVDECHKKGVEPDCKKEIELIEKVIEENHV